MERNGKDKIAVGIFVVFLIGMIVFSNTGFNFSFNTITGNAVMQGKNNLPVSPTYDHMGCYYCKPASSSGEPKEGLCSEHLGIAGFCDNEKLDNDRNWIHGAPTGDRLVSSDILIYMREYYTLHYGDGSPGTAWMLKVKEYSQDEVKGVSIDGKIITKMYQIDDSKGTTADWNVLRLGSNIVAYFNFDTTKFYACWSDGTCRTLAEMNDEATVGNCVSFGGVVSHNGQFLPQFDTGLSGYDVKCTFTGLTDTGSLPVYFASVEPCSNDVQCGYNQRCCLTCSGGTCQNLVNGVCDYKKVSDLPLDTSTFKLLDGTTTKTKLQMNNDFSNAWGTPNNDKILISSNTYIKKITDAEFWIDGQADCSAEAGCGTGAPECGGQCYLDQTLCNTQPTCSWNGNNCAFDCEKFTNKNDCSQFNTIDDTRCVWNTLSYETGLGHCCGMDAEGDPMKYMAGVGCQEGDIGDLCYRLWAPGNIVDGESQKRDPVTNKVVELCTDIGSMIYGFWSSVDEVVSVY